MASKLHARSRSSKRYRISKAGVVAASAAVALVAVPAAGARVPHQGTHVPQHGNRVPQHGNAYGGRSGLAPDSLAVAETVFPRSGVNLHVGQNLPYATNWSATSSEPTPVWAQAVAGGTYPQIFDNDGPDGSFAVETPVDIADLSFSGQPISQVEIPTNEVTSSFSSKSELALNLSTNGQDLSFSGYNAPVGAFDASNSNTPGIIDPTNPDLAGPYFRVAANVASSGQMSFTETNSYSGDNERAVLLDGSDGEFFAAGNDNNGYEGKKGGPAIQQSLIDATGAQIYPQSLQSEAAQTAAGGDPADLMGSFNIDQLPADASTVDKPGKDTNFRGLTVYDNVVYYTKGSGGNGVNTVYFVDTTGNACSTSNAVGLPQSGAPLPQPGVTYQMCILKGFNEDPASSDTSDFPFGLWFANKDTLYVADEGDGNIGESADDTNPYADAQAQQYAGLQKWTFNGTEWVRDYTLQKGLDLGQPYRVPGYPTGDNTALPQTYTGADGSTTTYYLPWSPATDGLRNISGHVNGNGTVTIYATTSTVSGSGDQGADPNKVVAITDTLGETSPYTDDAESFRTVDPARFGVRYGGVAVLPSNFGK